jgi:leucyl-tRNA synthetase
MMNEHYNPTAIEEQAQSYWEEKQSFRANEDLSKEKFFCLSMMPYPSGYLHMGHVRNYTIGDVIARYQRMLGKNVLQPMAWDAFGLPAENAAIKQHIPPAKWTYANISHMRQQFKRLGFAYDWRREIATCDPQYYRWEQWLFTKLYEKGLVYKKLAEVNWDPVDQTVLANEQVINGRGWRSDALVERREIPQWFFKITAYADELLDDIKKLDAWPEQVRTMQQNWIGRSEGVEVDFAIPDYTEKLTVFTTRPDTLYGVTYLAIAAQHPLAQAAAQQNPALAAFIKEFSHNKLAEAELASQEKQGMATGFTAIHPLTGQAIPVWVANFVLMEYGTGAIMAVPAHDQRDYEFAEKFGLAKIQVITLEEKTIDLTKSAFTEKGILMDSANFTGMKSQQAFTAIADQLTKQHAGRRKVQYRLRDWGISRQRYWGAPIPIIYCKTCGPVAVPEQDLPVVLPEQIEFKGVSSPLKSMPDFYQTVCPTCGAAAERETDTLDTFVESSWYFLRFACPNQHKVMLDDRTRYWEPVDCYVGGIEHAILHLLYARFFNKLLRDLGLVCSDEPFTRLVSQGMVLKDGSKMSKSKGNTVDPQSLIEQYGADTVRLFMIFAAPPEQALEWSDSGVEGAQRFLKRLWSYGHNYAESPIKEMNYIAKNALGNELNWSTMPSSINQARYQMYDILRLAIFDYERLQLNTVVSACMKLFNLLTKLAQDWEQAPSQTDIKLAYANLIQLGFSFVLRLLSPIAPHICHNLWRELEYGEEVIHAPWPKVNNEALQTQEVEYMIQVNGKLRSKITVPADIASQDLQQAALTEEKILSLLAGQTPQKVIVVPNKLINIVIAP